MKVIKTNIKSIIKTQEKDLVWILLEVWIMVMIVRTCVENDNTEWITEFVRFKREKQ